jgi:hypothetical protein
MNIIVNNNKRLLIKENNDIIDISDEKIIKYTGMYYLKNDITIEINKIKTKFIGKIESEKYHHELGTYGVYIKPLYIWKTKKQKWFKISHYNEPAYKSYFYYPHLLQIPDSREHFCSLYFIETIEELNEEEKKIILLNDEEIENFEL